MKRWAGVCLIFLSTLFAFAAAKEGGASSSPAPSSADMVRTVEQERSWARVEGEKRFKTNCGRCHQAPHKFSPRMMGTIVRHMRVRAMITDDDMKFILAYMTE